MLSAADLDQGVYVSYNVTGPVRVRFYEMHSPAGDVDGTAPPPVVTAVFLD